MAIVMIWVYYSAQIFLLGAEFTWVYANEYGSRRGLAKKGEAVAGTPEATEEAKAPVPTRSGAPASGAPAEPSPATDHAQLHGRAVARVELLPQIQNTPAHGAATGVVAAPQARPQASRILLQNRKAALGLAVTAGIVVAIAARFGALKRVARSFSRPQHDERRLAS
jgi:hypothetical protein